VIWTGFTPSIERLLAFLIRRSIAEANGSSRGSDTSGCSNAFPYLLPLSPILDRWSLAKSGKPQEEPSAGKPPARICEGEAEWLNYSTEESVRFVIVVAVEETELAVSGRLRAARGAHRG
jgi:hypothetical protein